MRSPALVATRSEAVVVAGGVLSAELTVPVLATLKYDAEPPTMKFRGVLKVTRTVPEAPLLTGSDHNPT
jgi:hypothetical protein